MKTLFLLLLIAGAAAQEMSSKNYQLERSAFISAGGSYMESVRLSDQFGAAHLGRMENSRFKIGAGVEWLALETETLPTAFDMGQNFPNPFNQSTVFTFSLPQPCRIEVAVYSMLGRRIATLIDELQAAGRHQFRYQGVDESGLVLPSGVYFCRITTKGFDKTIKFVILR